MDVSLSSGSNAVMYLVGTKVDMVEVNPSCRQVKIAEAESLAGLKHMVGFIETSAKENTNITRTFAELASKLSERHERLNSMGESEKSIRLTTVNIEKEKKQCHC